MCVPVWEKTEAAEFKDQEIQEHKNRSSSAQQTSTTKTCRVCWSKKWWKCLNFRLSEFSKQGKQHQKCYNFLCLKGLSWYVAASEFQICASVPVSAHPQELKRSPKKISVTKTTTLGWDKSYCAVKHWNITKKKHSISAADKTTNRSLHQSDRPWLNISLTKINRYKVNVLCLKLKWMGANRFQLKG